ncbi:MAG: hypothetical protein R6X33_15140 [Candidatus Brocadiia bacterium]
MKHTKRVATVVAIGMALFGLTTAPARAVERMTPTVTGEGYVWWEGEHAVENNFTTPDDFMKEGVEGFCSNDDWLTVSQSPAPTGGLTATWRIEVPKEAEYDLWARVGYRPWSGNLWRFDDGEWAEARADDSFWQTLHHARYRPTSWTRFGKVRLSAGEHTFQVRFPEGENAHQGFDCFILAERSFVPRGKYRPDQDVPAPDDLADREPAWWPFQPEWHPDQEPALDLSGMNDPIGSHGRVEMRDGELYFEDGTPVRFWGVNVSYHQGRGIYMTHEDADAFADFLARLGVNIVRLHVMHSANSLIDDSRNDTQHFDKDRLDRVDHLAAALFERGIYVNLDLMYHRMFKEGDNIDSELVGTSGEGDYNVNWAAGSAALFHPRAIELNRALYRKFLDRVNPYTGRRWADEPGMAMLTIQNEQSIFWGTTNIHRGRPREILNELYTQWLRERYGSQAYLAEAWQVEGERSPFSPGEDLDAGLIELGQVGVQSAPHLRKRGIDQLRFLYHMETKFYSETIAAMRRWGVKCPIITSNWRGAGETTRLVIQASALGDFVDRHYYSGGATLVSRVGQGTLGAAFDQVAGRAFGVSEWNAGTRGRTTPEVAPLVATMSAFQAWDAMFQFCVGSPTWETWLGGLRLVPGHYALYPAAAFIFRRGDIRPGELVFERRRSPETQFSFQPERRGAPLEVMAVGRVQNRYVDEPTEDLLRSDLVDRLWDREAGVVRPSTGEFEWRYADDLMRLDAARTQGAFGALAGRRIICPDVEIETPNEFCAVLVSSLEQQPISDAGRLLVSAVGRAQNLPAPPPTVEGRDRSVPPCFMEPVTGTVTIDTDLNVVHALDVNGYRVGRVPAERVDGKLQFRMEGAPQVLYYEVTR